MKIYSWNMLYRNLEQDRALEYIKNLDFDALCLQEVPENFLERLKTLPYHLVHALDVVFTKTRRRNKEETRLYHVILSRHVITASDTFEFLPLVLPYRTHLLVLLKEGIRGTLDKRGALYADIKLDKGLIRVFSLHLTLSSPSDRAREFGIIQNFLPKGFPAILAGDFNIVEHPLTKPFHWFFGASLAESSPWHDERSEVERRFWGWGLQNPLKGKITLGVSLSQLDHILVPQDAHVLQAEVVKDTYGSDHNPVFVEVVLDSRSQ